MPKPLPLASRRILVVDDQPSVRHMLEVALGAAGALVSSAPDGYVAVSLAREAPPELVLLDLVMPSMTGWEVIQALASTPQTCAIPVVLQTSAEDFASFDRAKKQGVAAFLSKPFRLGEVIETCRRVLEGARPLQGRAALEREDEPVHVRDEEGQLVAIGHLLDVAAHGAQVEADTPLALGQQVTLTYRGDDGFVTLAAEVRWVTKAGDGYQMGLAATEERDA
jgi:CheY-like chemotaxis protein